MSYTILTAYWVSYIYLGFVFMIYLYLELSYKNIFMEGLIAAFISRSLLQIISIFGYQDKRFDIAITGFIILMLMCISKTRVSKKQLL